MFTASSDRSVGSGGEVQGVQERRSVMDLRWTETRRSKDLRDQRSMVCSY